MNVVETPKLISELLDLAYPDATILASWGSAPDVVSMIAESPDGTMRRMHWVLGLSGRWTMIPLCEWKSVVTF